jgi:hypothetical protein
MSRKGSSLNASTENWDTWQRIAVYRKRRPQKGRMPPMPPRMVYGEEIGILGSR